MNIPREFHFIHDRISEDGIDSSATASALRPIVVPPGVSHLYLDAAGDLQLTVSPPTNSNQVYQVEPLFGGPQPQLLVVAPERGVLLVNGRKGPQLMLLGEQDLLQVSPRHWLHVSLFNRPQVGPPAEEQVGKECPVCCSRFESETRAYTCPHCSASLHLQGEETPADLRLECALAISECPVCHKPIELTEGYSWQPELYHA